MLRFLQGQIKRDPDGYADEFRQQVTLWIGKPRLWFAAYWLLLVVDGECGAPAACTQYLVTTRFLVTTVSLDLQYRHYKASLEIFKLKPTGDSHEFGNLVGFVSQVRVAAAVRPPGLQGMHCQTPTSF